MVTVFLIGLDPEVCLAISEGRGVLCALITQGSFRKGLSSISWICRENSEKQQDFSSQSQEADMVLQPRGPD
jgi:hypothetical protein